MVSASHPVYFASSPIHMARFLHFPLYLGATQRFRLKIDHCGLRGNRVWSGPSRSGRRSMPSCCEDKSAAMTAMHTHHKRILWIVLVLNAVMFGVESWAGLLAHSTSLLADALDMLGDALVYVFSLFV